MSESIVERIWVSASAAANQADNPFSEWHALRNATVRVLRRTLGCNPHGLAPVSVFTAACRFANDCFDVGISDVELAKKLRKRVRRLKRRARKGTL